MCLFLVITHNMMFLVLYRQLKEIVVESILFSDT